MVLGLTRTLGKSEWQTWRRVHARVVNVRNANHHKATTAIAKSAGRVVVETLNEAGMLRNRRLSRAIADAGMAGFLAKLEYKCAWYGAEYMKADRWYVPSKQCAHCGWKNDDLTLSNRAWWCGGCGVLNDRDANAAENLANWPGLSFPASGRGDRLCRQWSAKRQVNRALKSGLRQAWSIRSHQILNSGWLIPLR